MKPCNLLVFLNACLLINLQINCHGFGENTCIKLYDPAVSKRPAHWHKIPECFHTIKQIYDYTLDDALKAKSYDPKSASWDYQSVKKAGVSETNCYMRIWLDRSIINVIEWYP